MDRAKSQANKNIETVLLGHNSSIFDTPVLLRNSGTHFTERLQKMDICFADSHVLRVLSQYCDVVHCLKY